MKDLEKIGQTADSIHGELTEKFGDRLFIDGPAVLGEVLSKFLNDPLSLSENGIGWAVDQAVAIHMGPLIQKYLTLHKHMVTKGYTSMSPWVTGDGDRFAAVYCNEETTNTESGMKAMAFQNQNFTFMVVITSEETLHIRQCTRARESFDFATDELADLSFLDQQSTALNHEYLRYGDCRDRGYLVSIVPNWVAPEQWRAEHVLSAYRRLQYVVYDLSSWIDSIEDDIDE